MSDFLRDNYLGLIQNLDTTHRRFLYANFNLTDRLIGLIGPRGVGKTTLLLQLIKYKLDDIQHSFYISLDHIYFNNNSVLAFLEERIKKDGVRYFFIDEVHKYPNWSQELKNIVDSHPHIKIVFSGSSSLDLIKGHYDLSRRAVLYHLPGLSFREYLNFTLLDNLASFSFDELLNDHQKIAYVLSQQERLLGHFQTYLQRGYYPFVFENPDTYLDKLSSIIEKTIYEDISNFYNLRTANLLFFKKILFFAATSEPGELNVAKLSNSLGLDYKTTAGYITMLDETGLIRKVLSRTGGHQLVRKAEKLYLENTSLYYSVSKELAFEPLIGTIRELFFLSMLKNAGKQVFYPKAMADFSVGDYYFEIGGKNKHKATKQDKSLIVVKDDILIGSPNVIPLYLFGFLY